MIRELIQLAAVLGVLLCLGLVFTNLLKGVGKAGADIGAGIGSIFTSLGTMFDGLGSGAGEAARGAGQGLGTPSGRVRNITSGAGRLLPKAGHAAGSVLGGLGVGAAAIGAVGVKGARRGANVVSEAAKKVASSDAARSVRNAAKHASVSAKESLRTEARELVDDVKFGLGMKPNVDNEPRPFSAFAWEIDPTMADELRAAFDAYDVCHNWHHDPETGRWYVIFPTEEIGFTRQVMSEVGFAVDGRGVPAEWYEPVEGEVYDEESDEWVTSPARTGGPANDTPDGVPLDETAFDAGDADAVDAEYEDVAIEGGV